MTEHDSEPVPGLPETLPPGEAILWQGSPDARSLARRVFHLVPLGVYFVLLVAWRGMTALYEGADAAQALAATLVPTALALAAMGLLVMLAGLMARTTVYTITTQRVVMRIGIVLSVTFNIPHRVVSAAGLHTYRDGTGDLPLALSGPDRIAYLHLWPHARPWRIARPEPMLRAVPNADEVADILSRAVLAAQGQAAAAAATQVASETDREASRDTAPFAPAR